MDTSTLLSTSQKGNSLIYVLLGVLILAAVIFAIPGGSTYLMSHIGNSQSVPGAVTTTQIPITEPDSNWKTYNNQGVSFRYPSSWNVTQLSGDYAIPFTSTFFAFPVPTGMLDIPNDSQGVEVVNPNPPSNDIYNDQSASFIIFSAPGLSPSKIVGAIQNKVLLSGSKHDKATYKFQTMTINGVSASLYRGIGEDPYNQSYAWYVLLTNGTSMVEIRVPAKDMIGPTGNQILSSFKFTNPTPTSVTEQSCNISSDCPSGSTCETVGPIVDTPKRECVLQGQMVPLSKQY